MKKGRNNVSRNNFLTFHGIFSFVKMIYFPFIYEAYFCQKYLISLILEQFKNIFDTSVYLFCFRGIIFHLFKFPLLNMLLFLTYFNIFSVFRFPIWFDKLFKSSFYIHFVLFRFEELSGIIYLTNILIYFNIFYHWHLVIIYICNNH